MTLTLPIKRLANVTLGKMIQSEPSQLVDTSAPYLRAAHVQPHGRIIDLPDQRMWFSQFELRTLNLLRGDVVVVEGGAGYGRSAVIREDLAGWGFQNSIIRLRPVAARSDGRFLDYSLQGALSDGRIELATSTATLPHFTADKVSKFEIWAPALDEQRAIADYLDRETAQIDALVAKQEEFIRLLRERRRAAIENRLTSVDARRTSVRHLARLVSGSGFPVREQGQVGKELPFYKVKDLKTGRQSGMLDLPENSVSRDTAQALSASVIPSGSVAFAKVGAALLLGRVATLPVDSCVDNNMSALVPRTGFDPGFARYVMLTFDFKRHVLPGPVPSLDMDGLRAFRVPVLSLNKQRAIVNDLDEQTSRIDTLIAKTEEHIALAKERRSALITAAVTGQFDVRTAGKAG
ncbi:restriction endonuclease subunit S [Brevibacterium sp. p3-SID960]|uniref:restriction endonuclease subunit S n=1 Tax=Brevibacterium sp. p3-SID960 TaxID=2916063 RepID=UPI0021A7A7F1|nr:restriction endonuclease subunit S [Brevibacterium sp. p3-SID960]MCT1689770.1 restriction endonuclease subunit S [Brevibacterium sp. p3-SID960]